MRRISGKGVVTGRGGGLDLRDEKQRGLEYERGRALKKTHNRVGRFTAAFESIQRQLQLEPHPTLLGRGAHSPLSLSLSARVCVFVCFCVYLSMFYFFLFSVLSSRENSHTLYKRHPRKSPNDGFSR